MKYPDKQQAIREYIEANYQRSISVQDAAEEMNYSEAYFCRLFRQSFSESFTRYLARYRVEKAKELLGDYRLYIREVGEAVGYRDSNYFTKVFKRYAGVTPAEYRERLARR